MQHSENVGLGDLLRTAFRALIVYAAMAAVSDRCAVAQASLKTVSGRITSAAPSSFMVCLLPGGECKDSFVSEFIIEGPNPSRLLVAPMKITSAADALAASIIAPAGARKINVQISRSERALREIPICSKQDPSGLSLLVSPTPVMKVLRMPHGLLVANGSAILSLWDARKIGPVGENWPDSIANTSVESIRTGDSTLGFDLRMESAEGKRFRIMEGAGVRLQYSNANAQTADSFDRLIDSACRMAEPTRTLPVDPLRLMPESVEEGQQNLKDHSLNQWAEALFSVIGKKRDLMLDGSLNAIQEQAIADRLQERLGELKATVASLDSWLGAEFSRRIPDFTVWVNVSTRSKKPIVSTRRTSEGFVIDINTVTLRSLLRASNRRTSRFRLGDFLILRQFILEIEKDDPLFTPAYWFLSTKGLNPRQYLLELDIKKDVHSLWHRPEDTFMTIPFALLQFDLMDIRFNDALDFVLLHELGHIALGHVDEGSVTSADCEMRRSLEAQADAFAVSILTLRDPYRLRTRLPSALRELNDEDPEQSPERDFFEFAYTSSGLGDLSRAACGYESATKRTQAAKSVRTGIRRRVY
jgi:hypothetical protein